MQSLRLIACVLGAAALTHAATPVEKVIRLLEKLEVESQQEGRTEAAAYDKMACFCKAQADSKLYSIAEATAKVETLAAKIKKLDGEITQLAVDVAEGNTQAEAIQKEMADHKKVRDDAHHEYVIKNNDAMEAVTATEEGIEQMEASKAASFLQLSDSLQGRISDLLDMAEELGVDPAGAKMAAASGSKFHSNEIIETLRGVQRKFKVKVSSIQAEEAEEQHTFDMAHAAKNNQLVSVQSQVAQTEEIIAQKEDLKGKCEEDKAGTASDKAADQAFLDDLTEECEAQAKSWDQRSKARSNELSALAEALVILKEKVMGNYGANKKLNLLKPKADTLAAQPKPEEVHQEAATDEVKNEAKQAADQKAKEIEKKRQELQKEKAKVAAMEKELASESNEKVVLVQGDRKWVWVQEGTSFLQLRHVDNADHKVFKFLSEQASKLQSPILSTLVMRMKADHFQKVRTMIKDLISKLEADAEQEASQKAWCDEEMEKATSKRDESIGDIEGDQAAITETTAKIRELTDEISTLEVEIADLYVALKDATDARAAEKASNAKTLKDATAGLNAINAAVKVLKDFYDNALIQEPEEPDAKDKEGNTVKDLAPKTKTEKYSGNQAASSGIIGMMEVIVSDFEGTIESTNDAEAEAEKEFDQFKKDTNANTSEKKDLSKKKKGDLRQAEADLVEYKDDLRTHAKEKGLALDEISKLVPSCVSSGATHEEKLARREQEIDSLKDAYKIFESMSLVDKHGHHHSHHHRRHH